MRAWQAWGAAAATALAACGGGGLGPVAPDAAPSSAAVVLGGASDDGGQFVAVEDGADLPLIAGSQGGFHVWTGLRIQGAAGMLRLEREARRVSDDKLVLLASTLALDVPEAAPGEWWQRPDGEDLRALPSFMCPTPIGISVRDETLILRAQILDEGEQLLAEDSLVFVPRCPEGDQADFCVEICSG